MTNIKILLTTFIGILLYASCETDKNSNNELEHPNLTKLKKQSLEFIPQIVELNPNVYAAVGYDGSNCAMIIGDEDVIIIDALRSLGAAEKVAAEFRKITKKPVKALIYTHGHLDHTGGTSAFIDNKTEVKIIARDGFKEELQEHSPVEKILKQRNIRQFGRNLPDSVIINRGVAAGRTPTDRVNKGYIAPNMTFKDSLFIEISGVKLEIYAVNGETNDHLFVWCPTYETMFTGDNYYKAFPNLYAIRGSRYRDVESWGNTILKMSSFPMKHLVPGHTRPLSGEKLINDNLTNYSSAILSVYNQTIDCMNKGYTIQQTVESVKLPQKLSRQPNLQEFYGSVEWGVRSIYFHHVGWFDGNPTHLYPLPFFEEALNIIQMAGGEKKVYDNLCEAVSQKKLQWALQLADYLLEVNYKRSDVIKLKISALRKLAEQQINAPARNYYLSFANELEIKEKK